MKVFVLEDHEERCKWFKEQLTGQDIEFTIIKTAKEAKDILSKEKFDRLYLDHDLGGKIFVDPEEEETGTQVVVHIIENKLQKDAVIYIHSLNPISFDTMVVPLNKAKYHAVYKPFSILYGQGQEGKGLL